MRRAKLMAQHEAGLRCARGWDCASAPNLSTPRWTITAARRSRGVQSERSTGAAATFFEHVLMQLPNRVEAPSPTNDLLFTMRFAFHSEQRLTRFQRALQSATYNHAHTLSGHTPVERRQGYFESAMAYLLS